MDTIITGKVSIPRLGFGTFRMPGGGYRPVVESALALGYRHLDTAQRPESQQSNLDALNIRLDDEDRAAIAALPRDQRYVTRPFAPDWNALTL
jgi:diketogulonate reductase-like aldo/keto reductase